jgi:hypothetical protein
MLLLFAGLFVTIGLVSQIAGVFRGLIVEAQNICARDRRWNAAREHWNLFGFVRSVLAGSAAILTDRVGLEFASPGCSRRQGSSSLGHLRDYTLLA